MLARLRADDGPIMASYALYIMSARMCLCHFSCMLNTCQAWNRRLCIPGVQQSNKDGAGTPKCPDNNTNSQAHSTTFLSHVSQIVVLISNESPLDF